MVMFAVILTVAGIMNSCGQSASSPINLRFGKLDTNLDVTSTGQISVESGGVIDFESGSYLKFAGTSVSLSATGDGGISTSGTLSATTGISAGKYLGLTAITAMSDTTGWTGPRLFTFTGDSLYVYKANHTVVAFAKL